jgi:hypothetical protein
LNSLPKADWLPIGRAVFTYYGAGRNDEGGDPPGIVPGAAKATPTKARSPLEELADLLIRNTSARAVEIDPKAASFTFSFVTAENGAESVGGPPWALLDGPDRGTADGHSTTDVDSTLEGAEVQFQVTPDAVTREKRIRAATGLVWRQIMLRDFGKAVESGAVIVWARVGEVQNGFRAVPPDVWRYLTIVDWQNGIALSLDKAAYYSLHASRGRTVTAVARNERKCIDALAKRLREDRGLSRADARAFCEAVAPITARGFQERIWPEARKRAGLPALAKAGRKPKSSR